MYRHLGKETLGNMYLLSALTIASKRKSSISRKAAKFFFCVFNNMCRRHILHSVSGLNDYNQSIVLLSTMGICVDLAATVFQGCGNTCVHCKR